MGNICLKNNKGELVFDNESNAKIFSRFFSNLAKELVEKLPTAPNIFTDSLTSQFYREHNIVPDSFVFHEVNEGHIFKQLTTLNPQKASGIDNISGKFLKDGAKLLALPISQIWNLSIKLATFPSNCKIAKITPLYKKGCRTDPKNYRPISLLPIVSKVIEKVVHQQLQEYLDNNEILYKFQSGFRSNHSTDTCLSYLSDKILSGFDGGLLTGVIAIDLQKAFDTIDHKILLNKMKFLGFSETVIQWFNSYLSDRIFKINLNITLSVPAKINCGVPQGSILGPLLFSLYVNDMSQAVNSELYLYADDACLLFQHRDSKVINEQLNEDFAHLCDWFVDNKLSIHFGEDKTKCILFASKNKIKKIGKLTISYNNIEIKQHHRLSYLGALLDVTMSGVDMAHGVIRKINNRLKFLHRKDQFLNYKLRRLLCNALIQPSFDYVCSSWYVNLTKKMKLRLQATQNKCIRFCLRLGNRTHLNYSDFKKINWLPVEERVFQCISAHVFKFF